ncbi:Serine/threonine-protein kinase 32C [Liparis tanakae]|uniref:Serine/threonine-protein kinase 32C n=1 Tax=Liparis tanakae TaxID=230148 RepID=A0A4Z2E1I7_9TELE|nr:Serine/threonine-protein kinase 32C [Liparis tanakae]
MNSPAELDAVRSKRWKRSFQIVCVLQTPKPEPEPEPEPEPRGLNLQSPQQLLIMTQQTHFSQAKTCCQRQRHFYWEVNPQINLWGIRDQGLRAGFSVSSTQRRHKPRGRAQRSRPEVEARGRGQRSSPEVEARGRAQRSRLVPLAWQLLCGRPHFLLRSPHCVLCVGRALRSCDLCSTGHVHFTDFNIAAIVKDDLKATSIAGTKPYMGKRTPSEH